MIRFRKNVLLLIISLFTLAVSFDTLNFFCKIYHVDLILDLNDFEGEEKECESEKAEKAEKSNFVDKFCWSYPPSFTGNLIAADFYQDRINFSSADYSLVIYSPPELA